ncbi:MAG: hypothetical protein COA95_08245 [Methylophaga sp.]|nr:MAG: hypothetical protein COA95_08245 [Methylophaga sp.]
MDIIEVTHILKAWLNGSLDSHEWDNFISVKNKNVALEKIRCKAEGVWVENSIFLKPGAIDPCLLTQQGREEVAKLLALVSNLDVHS